MANRHGQLVGMISDQSCTRVNLSPITKAVRQKYKGNSTWEKIQCRNWTNYRVYENASSPIYNSVIIYA